MIGWVELIPEEPTKVIIKVTAVWNFSNVFLMWKTRCKPWLSQGKYSLDEVYVESRTLVGAKANKKNRGYRAPTESDAEELECLHV